MVPKHTIVIRNRWEPQTQKGTSSQGLPNHQASMYMVSTVILAKAAARTPILLQNRFTLGQRIRIPTYMLGSLRHISLAHFPPQLLKLEKANTSLGSIFWMSQLEEASEKKSWWCLVTSKLLRQIKFGQKSLKGKSPRTCIVAKGPDLKQGMLARYQHKRTMMPVDMGQTVMQKGVGWWKDMDIV